MIESWASHRTRRIHVNPEPILVRKWIHKLGNLVSKKPLKPPHLSRNLIPTWLVLRVFHRPLVNPSLTLKTMMMVSLQCASWLRISKVSSRSPTYDSSVDDLLSDELEGLKKPGYSKLASLAKDTTKDSW